MSVVYHQQPIIDLKSRNIIAYELLLRDLTGLSIMEVNLRPELFVQHMALLVEAKAKYIKTILSRNPESAIFLNFTPNQIATESFCDAIMIFKDADIPLHQIAIEVTEHSEVLRSGSVLRNLKIAKAEGLMVAIDDYGSGYSSPMSIIRAEPDIVKLDRAFLQEALVQSKEVGFHIGRRVLSRIISFLKDLGVKVVVEGIENQRQLEFVTEAGADLGQGFFLGKPSDITSTKTNVIKDAFWVSQQAV